METGTRNIGCECSECGEDEWIDSGAWLVCATPGCEGMFATTDGDAEDEGAEVPLGEDDAALDLLDGITPEPSWDWRGDCRPA